MTNAQSSQDYWVLVGTYTRGDSKGIYVLRLDGESGKLSPAAEVEAVNPTFLAVHPSGRYVYAVGEFGKFEGRPTGAVTAYAFDRETGRLTRLNSVSSMGGSPCHVTVDSSGRFALVANYTGGNVAVLPINADGSLGEAVCVQEHPGRARTPIARRGRTHTPFSSTPKTSTPSCQTSASTEWRSMLSTRLQAPRPGDRLGPSCTQARVQGTWPFTPIKRMPT